MNDAPTPPTSREPDGSPTPSEPATADTATSLRARRSVRRAIFNSRATGRAIMVAALVAAVASLIGAVVAWQFVGSLRDGATETLSIVDDTIVNVDATLQVAGDVITTIDQSLGTLSETLGTLQTSVGDGSATLDVLAELTTSIPPNLDRVTDALDDLAEAGGIVDDALAALDNLPIGPNFDEAAGLGAAVADVRDDITPIAEQLRGSTESIEALSASSDDLIAQLGSLRDDVAQLDRDLSNSERLIDGYQENAAEARRLAVESQDDLDRQVTMSRILIVVLALAIAVGQLATYRIGHELAKPRTQE